jgi:hypothetical protein
MAQDLMECVRIQPGHRHANAMMSLYQKTPTRQEFAPFRLDQQFLNLLEKQKGMNTTVANAAVPPTNSNPATLERAFKIRRLEIPTELIQRLEPRLGGPLRKEPLVPLPQIKKTGQ